MKHLAMIAAVALVMTACGEGSAPTTLLDPSLTIIMPGNEDPDGCLAIDFSNCFAKVDNQLKILYERNNTLSRRGEVEYKIASAANLELATIFLNPTYTVTQALRNLDSFIRQVERGIASGAYSVCAGSQILERAKWLRAKLVANDSDMTGAPAFDCDVSPVASVTGSGSTTTGVVLSINDPYHYTQDIDASGLYHTYTYFVVERQNGAAGDLVLTTAVAEQFGPVIFTIADPATTVAGTYVYRVTQCDSTYLVCSTATFATVTISEDGGGVGTCPHDNRNDMKDKDNKKPKCEKDAAEPKIHG